MTQVNVTVDDAYFGTIEDVVAELRSCGLEVTHVAGELGVVSGTVTQDEQLAALRSVPGVLSVEESPGG